MFTIYGFEECPYCQKAKELLTEEGKEFTFIPIPTLEERKAWLDERGFEPPYRTFPRIYQGDSLIGGYDELVILSLFW